MFNLFTRFLAGTFALILFGLASTPLVAETVDLANGNTGTITGVPGGTARFDFMQQQPTGTGVIKPFLRVQNFPLEQGYNTSGGTPFDDKPGPWTHDLRFSDLLQTQVNIGGVLYFKLLLDVNEPNGKKSLISLDQLQFYTSPVGSQTTLTVASLGTLRFSFKPATAIGMSSNDMVLMDAARNHGSGSGDMYAFIPADAFAGTAPTDFVYMYCFFGSHVSADITTAGGFEEWALVLNAAPSPTPTPTPTPPPIVCDPVAADPDGCYPFFPSTCFAGHAIWLPGLVVGVVAPPCDPSNYGNAAGTDGYRFVFTPGASFTENANGTATLIGHVESSLQPGFGFDVNMTFGGLTTTACPPGPLLELSPSCYAANGGPVDPLTWHFYATAAGTLTGTGGFAGGSVSLTPHGGMGCFQVGNGASGKNVEFGMSGWYDYNVVSQPTDTTIRFQSTSDSGRSGDINVNCGNSRPATTPTPTPTPPKKRGK